MLGGQLFQQTKIVVFVVHFLGSLHLIDMAHQDFYTIPIHSGHFCVRLTRSFQFQAATVDISRISFWEIPKKWMVCANIVYLGAKFTYLFVCLFVCLFVWSRVQVCMFCSHGCLQISNIPSEGPSEVKWHAIEIIHYPIQGRKNAGAKIEAVLYLCSTS